ncbi:MAG: YbaK/EbsC family protein [archaeon]|nr:prolyl-tRNA synthetase associated domain-containing protein [Nanoarchaeota archaeon]
MDIKQYLTEHGIKFKVFSHPPVFTSEQAKEHFINIRGVHSKNLFLKERNKAKQYYMLIVADYKKVDLSALGESLGHKIKFANENELKEILNLTPGSVSPSGLINDQEQKVHVLIDRDVWNSDYASFHSNANIESIEITKEDFHKYIKSLKNRFEIIDVEEVKE